MENSQERKQLLQAGAMLMILASFLVVAKVVTEIKSYKYIGGGVAAGSTMSFDGKGEVTAVPDIANIVLTIREISKNQQTAQANATNKEKAVLDFLDKQGVAKKDIQTESFTSYPQYDYYGPCNSGLCPLGNPKLNGYEVSESINVKVRDISKAGEIVSGIGAVGIKEISGPNYTVDNEEKLQAEARKKAIEDAKEKAEALADDLGVKLVRIVNFSENGNYPMPMYAFKEARDMAVGSAAPAPELPTGENKIISNVVITYEIR